MAKTKLTVAVQSDYRENDTQTDPWTPKYRVVNGKPEVLTLGFLKYKRDLPAWKRTVDTIEFIRKKRAWERYLSKYYTPENAQHCERIISDIETCELNLIEQDYDHNNKKRMELAAQEAEYFNYVMDQRYQEREEFVAKQALKKKEEKLRSIKTKRTRALRKIDLRERGVNMKYHSMPPIEEMCDPLSPFHVSVARFGKNPRYGTEVLAPECAIKDMKAFRAVQEIINEKPMELEPREKRVPVKHDCSHFKGESLSDDEYDSDKWEDPFMPGSFDDGTDAEMVDSTVKYSTPQQEKEYYAVLLVQTLIRGRAVQSLMFQGRTKNQALLDEMQSTTAFSKEDEAAVDLRRRIALQRNRYYHLNMKMIGLVAQVQDELLSEGMIDVIQESDQEVKRLTEERRAYLMAILGERTRWHREAAEAGRRQRELRRRDLYDEFFRQITRRNELTSEFYIKLIEDKVVRAIAEKEADLSTKQKADDIEEQEMGKVREKATDLSMRREMMARLLHNAYIPQVAPDFERRFTLGSGIDKARSSAVRDISERARLFYDHSDRSHEHDSADTLSPQSTDDPYDTELGERMRSLELFMTQPTMEVLDDADQISKEADKHKKVIIDKLRVQENERRKTILGDLKWVTTDWVDECYKHIYTYDELERASTSTGAGVDDSSEESSDNEQFQPGSENSVMTARRKYTSVISGEIEEGIPSEPDEIEFLRRLGDMPERIADELLAQAVIQHELDLLTPTEILEEEQEEGVISVNVTRSFDFAENEMDGEQIEDNEDAAIRGTPSVPGEATEELPEKSETSELEYASQLGEFSVMPAVSRTSGSARSDSEIEGEELRSASTTTDLSGGEPLRTSSSTDLSEAAPSEQPSSTNLNEAPDTD